MYAVAILCILESMLCAIILTFSGFEENSVFNLNENFYFSLTCFYERQWEIMIILELTLHAHGSAVAVFFSKSQDNLAVYEGCPSWSLRGFFLLSQSNLLLG